MASYERGVRADGGHRARAAGPVGAGRGPAVAGVRGWGWGALETLLAYNREDTVHLERLMELVVERLEAEVFRSVIGGEG